MARGEGIKPLGSLFEKYKRQLIAPQRSVKKCFAEVLHDLYGFSIKESEVDYSVTKKALTLKVRGPLKTEILLHRQEILVHLKGRLGEKSAPNTIL
jgi:hypothetical protein